MFVISAPDERVSIGKTVYFLNDTKDVIDLAYSMNFQDDEISELSKWLANAGFNSRVALNHIAVMCVTDEEARKMAAFFGCLSEYEKIYGTL